MRPGRFLEQLNAWAEKACILTVRVPSVAEPLRFAGVLRSYYSLASLSGWVLVPPVQHGGFDTMRLTQLTLDDATERECIDGSHGPVLRYSVDGATVFELEIDPASALTAPPRTTQNGRYLYPGGRRRRRPERWML